MPGTRPLNLPVILGTARKNRRSAAVAHFVHQRLRTRSDVDSPFIDIAKVPMPIDDAGEAIKDPVFAEQMNLADGLILVVPEYNHSFPGLLKHVLDSCLQEYIHKAAGIVGVSAGSFGGARMIQSLLPVLRELGLVTIFTDVYFASAHKVFDDAGKLLNEAFVDRTDKFLDELMWMSKTLRHGRATIPV